MQGDDRILPPVSLGSLEDDWIRIGGDFRAALGQLRASEDDVSDRQADL